MELSLSRKLRKAHPDLPETMQALAVRYQRRGFRPQTLLTSLLDPTAYPAADIPPMYHERWELELGFDEVKTHTLEREEALRSRAPERVRQELWIGSRSAGTRLRRLSLSPRSQRSGRSREGPRQ